MQRNDTSYASSMASTDEPDMDDEQTYIKNQLKNQQFSGNFSGNIKLVSSLDEYRAAIIVSAADEPRFVNNLEYMRNRLRHRHREMWIGATYSAEHPDQQATTSESASTSTGGWWTIWTELPEGTPIGDHMFKVKTIRWRPNEIIIRVRIVEEPRRQTLALPSTGDDASNDNDDTEWWSQLQRIAEQTELVGRQAWLQLCTFGGLLCQWLACREYSWSNAYVCVKYAANLVFLFGVLAFELIKWLGQTTMYLQSELREWIKVLMPLARSIVELVQKTIGGLMLLVLYMIRGDGDRGRQRPLMIEQRYNRQQRRPLY